MIGVVVVVDRYSRVVLLLSGSCSSLYLSLMLRVVLSAAVLPGRLLVPAVLRLVQMLCLKHRGGFGGGKIR